MTKLMTVLAAAFFAVTALFGTGAEAGFNVRIGAPTGLSLLQKTGCHGGGGYISYRPRYRVVHRSVKPKVHVARVQPAAPATVAKVEEPKVEDTVEPATPTDATENSSISTTTDDTTAATTDDATEKTADANDADKKKVANKATDCKAFFPAINKALTVPCN